MRGSRWLAPLLALLLAELASAGALALLERRGPGLQTIPVDALAPAQAAGVRALIAGENRYLRHDPWLGWSILPGGAAGLYHATADGLRAPAAAPPAPGVRRVLAVGDSFTHGDEVEDQQSWPAVLSEEPALEAANYGVPGYSPAQALLRWERDAVGEQADLVVFGFASADLARVLSRFPPFLDPRSALALGRPRLLPAGEGVRYEPSPLPELADYRALLEDPAVALPRIGEGDPYFEHGPRPLLSDRLALGRLARLLARSLGDEDGGVRGGRPYDPESAAFGVLTHLLRHWRTLALNRGQVLVVLLLPSEADLAARARGGLAAYAPLRDWLDAEEIPHMDAAPALEGVPEARRFQPGGHYSPEANRAVAEALADAIRP